MPSTVQAGAQRPRPRPAVSSRNPLPSHILTWTEADIRRGKQTTRCQWIAVTVILCVAMITSALALVAFFDYRVKLAEIARTTITTTTITITIATTTTTTTTYTAAAATASPFGALQRGHTANPSLVGNFNLNQGDSGGSNNIDDMDIDVDDTDDYDSGSGSDSNSVDTINFDNVDFDHVEDEDDEEDDGSEASYDTAQEICSLGDGNQPLEIPDFESDEENLLPTLEITNFDSDPDSQL
ncbi:hypothetical protein THAR02_11076 [Trichoderma harzianum]|uniref:Uncharacterized protein n=1 Tax=Trichoderma harzianum TaxID=5544 RepID=A0A0F9X7L8_TRIHA|nr:hypothetical protein THAR02_11076 [Trichoderma harzianum]